MLVKREDHCIGELGDMKQVKKNTCTLTEGIKILENFTLFIVQDVCLRILETSKMYIFFLLLMYNAEITINPFESNL